MNEPSYEILYSFIKNHFGSELVESNKDLIQKVCEAKQKVDKIIYNMNLFVQNLVGIPRKEAALKILSNYKGQKTLLFLLFYMLDGQGINQESKKKLYNQILFK